LADELLSVRPGTKTDTRIRAEQADNDAAAATLAVLSSVPASAGTRTKTGANQENGGRDEDPRQSQMYVIPGSGTPATIGREESEYTASEGNVRAISVMPWPVAMTKTVTNVKAENDDNDPKQASLHAIPTCS
jgi:hypothetical protein